jgi:hypothetical protein
MTAKWKYMTDTISYAEPDKVNADLSKWAENGWELVSANIWTAPWGHETVAYSTHYWRKPIN